MFKISWDTETGGVKLSSRVSSDTLGISPRPVFHEELDLLRLKEQGITVTDWGGDYLAIW